MTTETYTAGQAAQDTKITALEKNTLPKSFADKLPYRFGQFPLVYVVMPLSDQTAISADIILPWFHTIKHSDLSATFTNIKNLRIINLKTGETQEVSTDATGVRLRVFAGTSTPYEISVKLTVPATLAANTPYLLFCEHLDITIS